MDETVIIVLPLPPRILSPNKPCASRRGRIKKAAATKKCRRLARLATNEEEIDTGPWELASVRATFYHAKKRRRDQWNYAAMLKGYIDGVVDSGLLVDDDSEHLTTEPVSFKADKDYPRVELRFTRLTPDT